MSATKIALIFFISLIKEMLLYFHPGDLGSTFFEIIIVLLLVIPIIAVISGVTMLVVSIVNRKPKIEKIEFNPDDEDV